MKLFGIAYTRTHLTTKTYFDICLLLFNQYNVKFGIFLFDSSLATNPTPITLQIQKGKTETKFFSYAKTLMTKNW